MTATAKLLDELLKLSPSAIITLYEIETKDGTIFRFHNGTNELNTDVVWNGNTYIATPIQVDGFEVKGTGTIPRPTLTISNILGYMTDILANNAIIGAKFTRYRTFARYLDAVNFTNGNPEADPSVYFPVDVFYIDRKSKENKLWVEFELSAAWDLQGVMLPFRTVTQNICPWKYKGSECGWVPSGTYYDQYDNITTDSTKDKCGKKLSSCKIRFGDNAVLPYGGFPGAGKLRR